MNKDKRNKYLILAAALVLCAVLVVLIGTQMNQAVPQPPAVVDESESSSEPAEVVIPELPESSKDESKVTVPDNPSSVKPQEGAAVSSGTEQTIQDDVSKPEPPPPPEPDGETRDTDEKAQARGRRVPEARERYLPQGCGSAGLCSAESRMVKRILRP